MRSSTTCTSASRSHAVSSATSSGDGAPATVYSPARVPAAVTGRSSARGERAGVDGAGDGEARAGLHRVGGDLGRGPAGDDATAVEDREPVAELLGLVHVVRGEHDGGAAGAQLAHELPGVGPGPRVHPRGRLVEEHAAGAGR